MPKVSGPGWQPDQIYVTQKLSKLLTQAEEEAKRLKDDYVSVEHFLLAAADSSPTFKDLHIERDRRYAGAREMFGVASGSPARTRSDV